MTIASSLDAAIAAAIPRTAFDVVSVGVRVLDDKGERLPSTDKATWEIRFTDDATDEQKAAAISALKAFDLNTVREPRLVDFEDAMQRMTDDEWSALQAACSNSVRLARWYERAKTRGRIDLNDPEVGQATSAVVDARLFTRERLTELFGVKSL